MVAAVVRRFETVGTTPKQQHSNMAVKKTVSHTGGRLAVSRRWAVDGRAANRAMAMAADLPEV